jgi:hypothetical protein
MDSIEQIKQAGESFLLEYSIERDAGGMLWGCRKRVWNPSYACEHAP